MAVTPKDLEEFHQFATGMIGSGDPDLTFSDLFDCWESILVNPDDVKAIQASLRDMDAGEVGKDIDVFLREFRERNGLPTAP